MVENGRRRGVAFDVDSVRERWMDLLEGQVLPAYLERRGRLARRRAWFVCAMARQKARSRIHRARRVVEACVRAPGGWPAAIASLLQPGAPRGPDAEGGRPAGAD